MADDAATVEQLRAELLELRACHVAEVVALGEQLRTRDHALTETLGQQAATADILRVIAASSADLTSDLATPRLHCGNGNYRPSAILS